MLGTAPRGVKSPRERRDGRRGMVEDFHGAPVAVAGERGGVAGPHNVAGERAVRQKPDRMADLVHRDAMHARRYLRGGERVPHLNPELRVDRSYRTERLSARRTRTPGDPGQGVRRRAHCRPRARSHRPGSSRRRGRRGIPHKGTAAPRGRWRGPQGRASDHADRRRIGPGAARPARRTHRRGNRRRK